MGDGGGQFLPALNDGQEDLLKIYVMDYIRKGKLSKMGVTAMCQRLVELKNDDSTYIFYDDRIDKYTPANSETLRHRVRSYVKFWRRYLLEDAKSLMLEALYSQAEKAKNSSQSLKIVSDLIEKDEPNEDKRSVPSVLVQILHEKSVGQSVPIGQNGRIESVRDTGLECADTDDPLPDRRHEDTPPQMVPSGHDEPVYGLYEGRDTTERSSLPDTALSLEDPPDINGRSNMGAIE